MSRRQHSQSWFPISIWKVTVSSVLSSSSPTATHCKYILHNKLRNIKCWISIKEVVDVLWDMRGQVCYSSFTFPGDLHYIGMGQSPSVPYPLWLSSPQGKQFPLFNYTLLTCAVITQVSLSPLYFRSHNPKVQLDGTSFHEVL